MRSRTENPDERKGSTAWEVSVLGVFLGHIFPNSDWIRRDTPHISVLSPNVGKHGSEKLRIRTLITRCKLSPLMTLLVSATVTSGTINFPVKTCKRFSCMILMPLVLIAQKWCSPLKFSLINVNKSVKKLRIWAHLP